MERKALADKVIILGIDGMDSGFTKKLIDAGELPNIQKLIDRGACRDDLELLGQQPGITPPMWTTLATGARAGTHGITCFWGQDHENLDTLVFHIDSRKCKAEQLWNVLAEAGKKTLVWHWPGSSWPPSSDSPNLSVVDGITPSNINTGNSIIDWEKITVADKSFEGLTCKPRASVESGAGCILTNIDEEETNDEDSPLAAILSNDEDGGDHEKKVKNIVLEEGDGERSFEQGSVDIVNSQIKEPVGWTNAPEGALEFAILLADGLIRRPCLILKNEAGIYDRVAFYKSKKSEKPYLTLSPDDDMIIFTEELPYQGKDVKGSRYCKLVDLAEDGSYLRLWYSCALNCGNDALWHPKSLNADILEHVGPWSQFALHGSFDIELTKKLYFGSWEMYRKWQADALNYCAEEAGYDVIFSHLHLCDAMAHCFWTKGKPRGESEEDLELAKTFQGLMVEAYKMADRYVGEFLHLLDEGWAILMVSDHGEVIVPDEHPPLIGDPFGCNVRLMEELGFTVLKRDESGRVTRDIDWEHTKAVATRGTHIWINLKGRDTHGIVDPADKWQVEEEIIDALYSYRYKGKRVIQLALRNKDAKLLGMYGPECGDIIYWMSENFCQEHGDILSTSVGYYGTSAQPIFIAAGAGIKEGCKTERIIDQLDVAPTVAVLAGVRMPAQCEGAPVYQIFNEEF